ncbi:hypothetical protein JCM6882_008616 [Rhodosporidiobolus microsporus]
MNFQDRLPDETLVTIFSHFLPPALPSSDLATLLTLSTVSKRFRRILLPEIYGTLVYTYTPPPPAPSPAVPIDWDTLLAKADAGWDEEANGGAGRDYSVPALFDTPIHIHTPRWMELHVHHERRFRLLLRSLWENPYLRSLVRVFRAETGVNGALLPVILQAVTEVCPELEEILISTTHSTWRPPSSPRNDPRPFLPPRLRHIVWYSLPDVDAGAVVALLGPLKQLDSACLSLGRDWEWHKGPLSPLPAMFDFQMHTIVRPSVLQTLLAPSASLLTSLSIRHGDRVFDLSPFRSLDTLTFYHGHRGAAIRTLATCPPSLQHLRLIDWSSGLWPVKTEIDRQRDSLAAVLAHLPTTLTSLTLPYHLHTAAKRPDGRPCEHERESFLQVLRTPGWLPLLNRLEVAVEVEITKWGRMVQLGQWKVDVREVCEERGIEFFPNEDGLWNRRRHTEEDVKA